MLHKGFHSDCDDDNGDDDDDDDDDDDNVDDEADNENYDDDDDFIQVSGSTIVMTGGLDTEASVTEVFHFFCRFAICWIYFWNTFRNIFMAKMCFKGVWNWWRCNFQKPPIPCHRKVVSSASLFCCCFVYVALEFNNQHTSRRA